MIVMLIMNILKYTSPNSTKNIKLSNILVFRWKSYYITYIVYIERKYLNRKMRKIL